MKRLVPLAMVGLLGLTACAEDPAGTLAPGAAALDAASPAGADGYRFVILLRSGPAPADLAAKVEAAGGQLAHVLPQVGIAIATASNSDFARAVARDAWVASVGLEPAVALPEVESLDAASVSLLEPAAADDLYNVGLVWGVERVNAPAAWARGAAHSGEGAVVGILDTGIASNHPDVSANLVFNSCFTSAGQVVGRDWQADDPCNPYPTRSDHGTHVAGTAAASFGGGRVVGVAPNASLANYNVFEFIPGCGTCSFSSSRWRAMVHAADAGVDVLNMSLGSFTFLGNDPKKFEVFGAEHAPSRQDGLATFLAAEKRVADYVTRQGTVMASSAGNAGFNLNGAWVATPGQIQGHITVGATGIRPEPRFQAGISTDVRAFFSNYGAAIDVAAPGGDCGLDHSCSASERPGNWFQYLVLSSTVRPATECAETQSCRTGYGWKGGTSMAAPHVAGVAAIVRAVNPGLSASQVTNVVRSTAQWLGDRQEFGHGMVDAAAAAKGF